MRLWDTCPECGSPTPGGGLCRDCLADETDDDTDDATP